jgi:hypothetical protein
MDKRLLGQAGMEKIFLWRSMIWKQRAAIVQRKTGRGLGQQSKEFFALIEATSYENNDGQQTKGTGHQQ